MTRSSSEADSSRGCHWDSSNFNDIVDSCFLDSSASCWALPHHLDLQASLYQNLISSSGKCPKQSIDYQSVSQRCQWSCCRWLPECLFPLRNLHELHLFPASATTVGVSKSGLLFFRVIETAVLICSCTSSRLFATWKYLHLHWCDPDDDGGSGSGLLRGNQVIHNNNIYADKHFQQCTSKNTSGTMVSSIHLTESNCESLKHNRHSLAKG